MMEEQTVFIVRVDGNIVRVHACLEQANREAARIKYHNRRIHVVVDEWPITDFQHRWRVK